MSLPHGIGVWIACRVARAIGNDGDCRRVRGNREGDLYEVLVEARDAWQMMDFLIRSGKHRRLAEGAVRTTRTIEPPLKRRHPLCRKVRLEFLSYSCTTRLKTTTPRNQTRGVVYSLIHDSISQSRFCGRSTPDPAETGPATTAASRAGSASSASRRCTLSSDRPAPGTGT